MRLGIIYMGTSPSGKSYIGQTVQTFAARKRSHKNDDNCPAFHAAIKKYGFDKITWRTLAVVGEEFLNDCEKYFIKLHGTFGNGYNLTDGGEQHKRFSKEVLEEMSRTRKGRKHKPETIEKIRQGNTGKKRSPETCEKLSRLRKGRIISKEWAQKIGDAHRGKKKGKRSMITRERLSKSLKGKPAWNKGIPRSQETKDKISATKKANFARKQQETK